MDYDKERRAQVAEAAIIALFAVVSEAYPEVQTGDFPPDADDALFEAITAAIKRWLDVNAPHPGTDAPPRRDWGDVWDDDHQARKDGTGRYAEGADK